MQIALNVFELESYIRPAPFQAIAFLVKYNEVSLTEIRVLPTISLLLPPKLTGHVR